MNLGEELVEPIPFHFVDQLAHHPEGIGVDPENLGTLQVGESSVSIESCCIRPAGSLAGLTPCISRICRE
ncbi:MAG: hypothetical protein HC844_00350 [Tabrizicola sp.]|nr:hypothetical protein [Tabrizicola sp.]